MPSTSVAEPLLWPTALVRPPAPAPHLVYLDMNHWIYLSMAAAGRHQGARFITVLEQCRAACVAGTAVFVISGHHYMELAKIEDPAQRARVANVMEELSNGFTTLLSRRVMVQLEIEALLDSRLGARPEPVPSRNLIGNGVGHAFGHGQGGALFKLKAKSGNSDEVERLRLRMGAAEFDQLMHGVNVWAERGLLAGPADADRPALERLGYIKDVAEQINQKRAAQENEQRTRMAGTPWAKGGKLSDVVLLREVFLELKVPLLEALRQRGLDDIGLLGPDKEATRAIVKSMPISLISAWLKAEHHRNASNSWTSNDIFDIDAMSHAVPYCDIVVTEKHRWNDLRKGKLDSVMNTLILRRLSDLPDHL